MSIHKNSNSKRTFISTYLGQKEAEHFEEIMCQLGISKAALGKALIRVALSNIKESVSSRQALKLIKLGKLN